MSQDFFKPSRRQLLALAAAGASLPLQGWAQAPSFATRSIRVLVPFAAGGATDTIARAVSQNVSTQLGQTVLVENKAGAAGLIAGETLVKSPADGLTVLLGTTSTMLSNKYLFKKTPYDSLTDVTPLVRVCLAPIVLVVTADTPVQDMAQFMDWIQANKGKLSYGSYGMGSHGQMVYDTLNQQAGADMTHIAYKGEAPMVNDLLGGQIKLGIGSMTTMRPHIESGKLRALGVTGPSRIPLLPDVPTFKESGFTQDALTIVGWLAMSAPKGMSAELARQWAEVANRAIGSREGRARIIAAGFVPVDTDTPESFGAMWQKEGPIWERLLREAGVQPQ